MVKDGYSRYDDEPRRPSGGLSLSTGRLEGRSSHRSDPPSRKSDYPEGRRHNPLRDDYPRSSDRRREPEEARRHAGRARNDDYLRHNRSDGAQHRSDRSRSEGARATSPRSHAGRASHAASPFDPRLSVLTGGNLTIAGFDARRLGLSIIAVLLAIVFAMALFHIGPFALSAAKNGDEHVGVFSANAVAGNGAYLAQNIATQMSIARPVEPALAELPAHTPTREDLSGLAGQEAPYAFALNVDATADAEAPVLSDRSLVSLNNALAYYDTHDYAVGYLLMDLGTGRGIAGNLDASIYGASSFKGPFCAYIVNKEFPNDINNARSSRMTLVENTIVWSDNSSYGKLRRTYGNEGMEEWLSEAGVSTALLNDTYFPTYTPRQSALMWLKIYDYLEHADTTAAQWLSDTFGKTEVSFLRNGALGTTSAGHTDYLPEEGSGTEEGIEETEADAAEEEAEDVGEEAVVAAEGDSGELVATSDANQGESTVASIGTNITVRNKAGWIDGQDDDAICDSGIVTINGRDYLMVIMTAAPDSADGEQAFAHLARTLFEIRSDLV